MGETDGNSQQHSSHQEVPTPHVGEESGRGRSLRRRHISTAGEALQPSAVSQGEDCPGLVGVDWWYFFLFSVQWRAMEFRLKSVENRWENVNRIKNTERNNRFLTNRLRTDGKTQI